MDEQQPVGVLTFQDYKANVYSTSIPGEFRVAYIDASGTTLEEAPLTGISTYRQREAEIVDRLQQLHNGSTPSATPDLGDAGEY